VSYTTPATKSTRHAARGKPARLAASPDPRYPGCGAASLTDGLLAAADHTDPFWLGFLGKDLEATIDLGEPTEIRRLAANFLQSSRLGVFLPALVEFSLSGDGKNYRIAATVKPASPSRDSAPRTEMVLVDGPKGKARYVRVRAVNFGKIPAWVTQQDLPAWLFIDEILVNP
jgi:hexosaminidase